MAKRIADRAQNLLDAEEQNLAGEEFHRRMRETGDLGAVLRQVADEVNDGQLNEAFAARIFEEAILMSRPLYVFGSGKAALDALRSTNPDAAKIAEDRITIMHSEISGPEGMSPRNRLTEPQLDPLRYLYETLDAELVAELAKGDQAEIPATVRAQAIALADHLQRCQYLSGTLLAGWMMARKQGLPLNITSAEMDSLARFAAEVIAPVELDPTSTRSLREALNARTRATQAVARRMAAPRVRGRTA